jgi:hypothetical protein
MRDGAETSLSEQVKPDHADGVAPRRRRRAGVLGVLPGLRREGRRAGARKFWADLCKRGWRRVTEQELNASRMSHRRLREMAYQR